MAGATLEALEVPMRNSLVVGPTLAALGTILACSSTTAGTASGGGTGTISGTVAGTTFTVGSGIAFLMSSVGSANGYLGIQLHRRSDMTCGYLQSSWAMGQEALLANDDELILGVTNESMNVVAGTYPVIGDSTDAGSPNTSALSSLLAWDSSCTRNAIYVLALGSSGTVTISKLGPSNVTGTFNVTYGNDGSATGSFDVPLCVLPEAGTPGSGGADACKQ
jgi:hypothetical protein